MIRVIQSRNIRKLLLKRVCRMPPEIVFNMLKQSIKFEKLMGREIYRGYFEYQITFSCNTEAVLARRELLRNIRKFGRNVAVLWDFNGEIAPALSIHSTEPQMHLIMPSKSA